MTALLDDIMWLITCVLVRKERFRSTVGKEKNRGNADDEGGRWYQVSHMGLDEVDGVQIGEDY